MHDWNALVPEPTNLIALWPHAAPPTLPDAVDAFSRHLGRPAAVLEELPSDDPAVTWSAVISLPRDPSPVVLWVERAQPLSDHERDALSLPDCHWAIGAQTGLDRADPLTGFHHLVNAIAGRRLPDIPAILDIDTTRWYPRADLDAAFAIEGIEPGAEVLWTIQLVEGRTERQDAERAVWLHTHGLLRCGRPELEMIEVPSTRAAQAADLMQHVAGLLLERDIPSPGAAFEIGPDLLVSLQRWQEVAPFVTQGAPGGTPDRTGERAEGHTGPSAVICALVPEGVYRKLWVWPREAIERRASDEATVFTTTCATERQASLARAAWRQFIEAFASSTDEARFGVKAGFADDHARGREHLWFEVCCAEEDRVEGRLMHEPVAVGHLHAGDRTWIDLEQLSDWRVVTAGRAFGPDEADDLSTTRQAP